MANLKSTIDARIIEAVNADDIEALEDMMHELFKPTKNIVAEAPFAPALELRKTSDRKNMIQEGLVGNAALDIANSISRAIRRVKFNLKTASEFDGIRIIEEGDSWHQYPMRLDDIIDQLMEDDDKAILSLGAAGDTISDILGREEYITNIRENNAQAFLLSAGGNDLFGDGALEKVLINFKDGFEAHDAIDHDALEERISSIMNDYSTIISNIVSHFPKLPIFSHGYDLPFPQEGGKWLGKPLAQFNIPLGIGREVIRIIMDKFNDELNALETGFSTYTHIDLRGIVDRGANSWYDELHPKDAGFERAANAVRKRLAPIVAGYQNGSLEFMGISPPHTIMNETDDLGITEKVKSTTIILDPGHGGTPPPNKLGGSSWNNAKGPAGTLEKTLTIDVAKRTKIELENRGYTVYLTRNGDSNLSLRDRASYSKKHHAPVFISIHFNGYNKHVQGTETFVHTSHRQASADLCRTIQARVVGTTRHSDRNHGHPNGVKQKSLGVLNRNYHSSQTACVLLEVSFMDVAKEEMRLKNHGYKSNIASAIANGIEDYLMPGQEIPFSQTGDELGDAIEVAAFEEELSVAELLQSQDEVTFSYNNNEAVSSLSDEHQLAIEHITQSLGSSVLSYETESEDSTGEDDDINEFSTINIGDAPDFSGFGHNPDADKAVVEEIFKETLLSTSTIVSFEDYIGTLNLRYFRAAEFLYLGASNQSGKCKGKNTLPPQYLWPNIANSVRMLDEIRHRLGAPVRILSCYRSSAYNRCISGASNSQHVQFRAIDWRCSTGTPKQWLQIARIVRNSNSEFKGGIGLYSNSRFIHIDTRGHNKNWGR